MNNTDRYPLIKPYPWQASASLANRVISVLPMITKPVTCCIELRYSYSVYDIDAASILIDDTIRVDSSLPIMIGDLDLEGILGIQVSFKKEEIISNTLKNLNLTDDADSIEVNLKITGRLNYGQPFAATATIKIFFLGNGIAGVFLR